MVCRQHKVNVSQCSTVLEEERDVSSEVLSIVQKSMKLSVVNSIGQINMKNLQICCVVSLDGAYRHEQNTRDHEIRQSTTDT